MGLTMAILVQLNQEQFKKKYFVIFAAFLENQSKVSSNRVTNTHLNQTSSASSNVIRIGKQWRDEKFEYVKTDTYIAVGLYIAV